MAHHNSYLRLTPRTAAPPFHLTPCLTCRVKVSDFEASWGNCTEFDFRVWFDTSSSSLTFAFMPNCNCRWKKITLCRRDGFYTLSRLCEKWPSMEFWVKTEIKIKQTSERFKFENAQCRTHFVCHPTPGHVLPYQKACCKRRFKGISSLSSSFFLTKWNECWWKTAILLFALECVLLPDYSWTRLWLEAVFIFPCHAPTLCLSSLILWSSHNSTVCHSCLMCREWIKQSVISTWESPVYICQEWNPGTKLQTNSKTCICEYMHVHINNTHNKKMLNRFPTSPLRCFPTNGVASGIYTDQA